MGRRWKIKVNWFKLKSSHRCKNMIFFKIYSQSNEKPTNIVSGSRYQFFLTNIWLITLPHKLILKQQGVPGDNKEISTFYREWSFMCREMKICLCNKFLNSFVELLRDWNSSTGGGWPALWTTPRALPTPQTGVSNKVVLSSPRYKFYHSSILLLMHIWNVLFPCT